MRLELLILGTTATLVLAARPTPKTPFGKEVFAAIDPVLKWNMDIFRAMGDYYPWADEWHNNQGKPNSTKEMLEEFVVKGAAIWAKAGAELAQLAKRVDRSTANEDYVQLMKGLFPTDLETNDYFGLLDSKSPLGKIWSEEAAHSLAGRYDQAWLSAVKAVEVAAPGITRDYKVSDT